MKNKTTIRMWGGLAQSCCAALMLCGVLSLPAQAQLIVSWSPSAQYDNGFNPKVAYSGNLVVDVHNGTGGVGQLWYRVGQLNSPFTSIAWSNSHQYQASGFNPSVALSGATVVEVHNKEDGAGPLYYRVGTVNSGKDTIKWGAAHKYDTGFNPSVALSGTTAIEVHNGGSGVGPEWYRIGTVDVTTKTIAWSNSSQYDTGLNPSVAVSSSWVLEVHNSGSSTGPLWYHAGVISGSTVQWASNGYQYDNGFNPAISLSGFDAVEVHNQDAGGLANLINDAGQWGDPEVGWAFTTPYDVGMNPSVANNGSYAIEVHNGADGFGALWYRIGQLEIIQ